MRSLSGLGILLGLMLVSAVPAVAQGPSAATRGGSCDGISVQVAGEARCFKPGETFRDCPSCPEMVVVGPGSFEMGSEEASSEEPIHTVTLAEPFAVARFEATFAEWDACVADGACHHDPTDKGWGRGEHPVFNVSWNDVTADFLPWLSAKAGKEYRLLSEAEWEYAARAGSATIYSWGDEIGQNHANCDGCGSAWDNRQPAPVGSFAPNAFGLHDMHGNLWEWTADCYTDGYESAPANGSAVTAPDCSNHAVRGGGWSDRPKYQRSAIRYGDPAKYRNTYVGFRVARGL